MSLRELMGPGRLEVVREHADQATRSGRHRRPLVAGPCTDVLRRLTSRRSLACRLSLACCLEPGLLHEPGQPAQPGQAAKPADHDGRPDQRAGRYFLAGSLVIFLAGLGTAAVIAGGEPQAQAPAPPVTPSIDVIVAPHIAANFAPTAGTGATFLRSPTDQLWWRPDVEATTLPGRP